MILRNRNYNKNLTFANERPYEEPDLRKKKERPATASPRTPLTEVFLYEAECLFCEDLPGRGLN